MKKTNNLHLLWVLAKTDFKMRYNGSVLGYLWALLKPLLMFGVLYVFFAVLMRWDMPNYRLYLFLGIMIWNFFSEGTMAGLNALLSKGDIIKKVYFPRILVVIASTLSAFMTLLLNIVIFLIFCLIEGFSLHWMMMFLPIYLMLLYALVLGLSMMFSVLQVRYRDISQIWEVLLQAGFFLTPIFYPLTTVPEKFLFYMFLNPMTGIMQYSRLLMLDRQFPSVQGVSYLLIGIFIIFSLGWIVFKKLSPNIAEKL